MLVPGGPLNVPEFLRYVLADGFGVKDATKFLAAPMMPAELGAPPPMEGEEDTMSAAPQGAMPEEAPPEGAVPPEILAQLAGQIGLG
jgi:hypothetical protein